MIPHRKGFAISSVITDIADIIQAVDDIIGGQRVIVGPVQIDNGTYEIIADIISAQLLI